MKDLLKKIIAVITLLTLGNIPPILAEESPINDKENIQKLHTDLMSRFKPKIQNKDDEIIMWTGYEQEFSGDCDDYYIAARARLEELDIPVISVLGTHKRNQELHMMACFTASNDRKYCLDNLSRRLMPWFKVKNKYTLDIVTTKRVLIVPGDIDPRKKK